MSSKFVFSVGQLVVAKPYTSYSSVMEVIGCLKSSKKHEQENQFSCRRISDNYVSTWNESFLVALPSLQNTQSKTGKSSPYQVGDEVIWCGMDGVVKCCYQHDDGDWYYFLVPLNRSLKTVCQAHQNNLKIKPKYVTPNKSGYYHVRFAYSPDSWKIAAFEFVERKWRNCTICQSDRYNENEILEVGPEIVAPK